MTSFRSNFSLEGCLLHLYPTNLVNVFSILIFSLIPCWFLILISSRLQQKIFVVILIVVWNRSDYCFIFSEIIMNKNEIKNKIVHSLKEQKEVKRIIVFGSFNKSDSPNDIDIAVVQNSSENYMTLALRYRKLIRNISREIAVDIFPIVEKNDNSFFRNEVSNGEVIYAAGN